jgi:hypothetical protein
VQPIHKLFLTAEYAQLPGVNQKRRLLQVHAHNNTANRTNEQA